MRNDLEEEEGKKKNDSQHLVRGSEIEIGCLNMFRIDLHSLSSKF